jgi:hypothetical protein
VASWSITFGPAAKATVNSQIGAAMLAQATGLRSEQPLNAADTTTLAHFAAAISAQAAVAALTGNAPRVQVTLQGYRDTIGITPFAGAAASK